MNLIVDYGNTNVKYAIFNNNEILHKKILNKPEKKDFLNIINEFPEIKNSIISSVSNDSVEITKYFKQNLQKVVDLDKSTALPIVNLYKSPDTLGYDRIAAVVGAAARFPGEDILVIDSGTAITFDLINSKAEFLGGNISPGAGLRALALNKYTSKLPLVELSGDWSFPGKTTEEAIRSGVITGIVHEIDGYIDQLKHNYPDLRAVLTGGNINLFDKKLKNIIFVDSNLNLYGLNRILEYNAL
jgi:type III pantothenate kinase